MSMLMRSAAMRRATMNTNQQFLRGAAQANQEMPKKRKSIDSLDNAQEAGKIVKYYKFLTTCGIKASNGGRPMFFAQLSDKQSFFCQPVMPKDDYGNELTPANVTNGHKGYLVLIVSANADLEEDERGQNEFTIRPEFGAFEDTLEAAEKAANALRAELAKQAK